MVCGRIFFGICRIMAAAAPNAATNMDSQGTQEEYYGPVVNPDATLPPTVETLVKQFSGRVGILSPGTKLGKAYINLRVYIAQLENNYPRGYTVEQLSAEIPDYTTKIKGFMRNIRHALQQLDTMTLDEAIAFVQEFVDLKVIRDSLILIESDRPLNNGHTKSQEQWLDLLNDMRYAKSKGHGKRFISVRDKGVGQGFELSIGGKVYQVPVPTVLSAKSGSSSTTSAAASAAASRRIKARAKAYPGGGRKTRKSKKTKKTRKNKSKRTRRTRKH